MNHRRTYMHINFQQNWVSRSVKTVHTNLFAQYRKLHKFGRESIFLDMHHHKTYMYINFHQNRVKTQVMTVLTSLFAKKSQVA